MSLFPLTFVIRQRRQILINLNADNKRHDKNTLILEHKNMEIQNCSSDTVFDENLYTITWSDIENTEIDYENYLDDIESFFREDFENDILEEGFHD